jgi:hypothetical protein
MSGCGGRVGRMPCLDQSVQMVQAPKCRHSCSNVAEEVGGRYGGLETGPGERLIRIALAWYSRDNRSGVRLG